MVKISVIVPVYNPPKHFLEDCINSLLQQTLSDIEIILVDNGSTGGCSEVLDSAAKQDSRVVLQRFSENRQFSGAVNSGLALATGKYILIVDSDDYLDCNACRKLYAEMEKHPKTDMLFFCAYEKMKEESVCMKLQSMIWIYCGRTLKDGHLLLVRRKDFFYIFLLKHGESFIKKSSF